MNSDICQIRQCPYLSTTLTLYIEVVFRASPSLTFRSSIFCLIDVIISIYNINEMVFRLVLKVSKNDC